MSDEKIAKAAARAGRANLRLARLLKARAKGKAEGAGEPPPADDAVKVMGAAVAPLAVKDLDVLGV